MTETHVSVGRLQAAANEIAARFQPSQDADLLALPRDAEKLLAAFRECLEQGYEEDARHVLLDEDWNDQVYDLFHLVYLRHNDGRLKGSGQIPGLKVSRADLATTVARIESGVVRLDEIDASLRLAESGTPYVVPTDAAETVVAVFVGDVQLFVAAAEDELESDRAEKDVVGYVREQLLAGSLKRVMWGAGTCTFTTRRLLGLVFDDPSDAKPPLPDELRTMPRAKITGHDLAPVVGSLLSFSADRRLFTAHEIPDGGFLGKRLTFAQLVGDMPVAASLHAYRVVDSRNKLVRPGKGVVAGVVDNFIG